MQVVISDRSGQLTQPLAMVGAGIRGRNSIRVLNKRLNGGVVTGPEGVRLPLPVDLSIFHEDDTVSDPEDAAHFVGNDDVGDPVVGLQALDQAVNRGCGDGVEPSMWLVVTHAGGVVDDGPGEGHPLFHATGEGGRHFFLLSRKVDDLEHLGDSSVQFLTVFDSGFDQGKGNVLGHAHGVEQGTILKHDS